MGGGGFDYHKMIKIITSVRLFYLAKEQCILIVAKFKLQYLPTKISGLTTVICAI
jgi:hypothetical protein